ncbi:DUF2834 domain-containing protein [uncultured Paracoccus sp.]|uniref:DUF2834 domain-containing protein n=1 Tax=uncultured Paracoccus sp. TaxID=189685 RepID=UPI002615B73E|nr:DUF2834 domain-containing protein [uncultured Paracoccus sp.]
MFADLTPLRTAWLILALAGGLAGAAGLLREGAGLPAGSGAVAALTLALWCAVETHVRRNWAALLTIPALALGVGCALPLYLFLRSARID